MHISCIIIARGGSKGIPKKNLIPVLGKPLIYWTIGHALSSKMISDIWVSTDDKEISDYSQSLGVNVIDRPTNLSVDKSTSESAWIHAVNSLKERNINPDILILPQVTSPIRDKDDFDTALFEFIKNDSDSLLSVTRISDYLAWELKEDGNMHSLNYDYKNRLRRQNMPVRYLENGSFYICKTGILINKSNRLGGRISVHEMESHKQFQIDDFCDIKLCEAILREYCC